MSVNEAAARRRLSRRSRPASKRSAICPTKPRAAGWLSWAPARTDARVLALVDQDRTITRISGRPVAGMLASLDGARTGPGDRLGPWTLRGELGRGGMGRVMLAERSDGLYEQRVAIKLLRGFSGEAALAQLAHERQVLAIAEPPAHRAAAGRRHHAGGPALPGDGTRQGRAAGPYAARSNWAGRGADALRTGLRRVVHAHRQLVVHCDIKPGNVLVGDDGRAMLLDFGIAQLQGKAGQASTSLTPRYASPEQMAGAPATSRQRRLQPGPPARRAAGRRARCGCARR
jgi:hypothetical protein